MGTKAYFTQRSFAASWHGAARKRPTGRFLPRLGAALGVGVLALATRSALAIDLMPEDGIAPPVGLSSLQLSVGESRRSDYYQSGDRLSSVTQYNMDQANLRWAHAFSMAGRTSVAYAQLPFYKVSTENMILPNGTRASDASGGVGDLGLLLATWLLNDKEKGHYVALGAYAFLPTGQYDADNTRVVNTNPGSNRYRAALQIGHHLQLTKQLGWMVAADTIWSGKNTKAYWGSPTRTTRRQEAVHSFQTALSLRFSPQFSVGASYFYTVGGETSLGGVDQNDSLRSHRGQLSATMMVAPTVRVSLTAGKEFKTENGFIEDRNLSLSIARFF